MPVAPGLPAPADSAEPTQGAALADNLQIGFAYQMLLEGRWHKVRLRHKQTVSLTHRMLLRLCETGRLRAFESAALIERATARARRQLAALGAGQGAQRGAGSRA